MDERYLWQFSNKYQNIRERLEYDIMHSIGLTDNEYNNLLQMYEDVLASEIYLDNLIDKIYNPDAMNNPEDLF